MNVQMCGCFPAFRSACQTFTVRLLQVGQHIFITSRNLVINQSVKMIGMNTGTQTGAQDTRVKPLKDACFLVPGCEIQLQEQIPFILREPSTRKPTHHPQPSVGPRELRSLSHLTHKFCRGLSTRVYISVGHLLHPHPTSRLNPPEYLQHFRRVNARVGA